MDLPMKITRSQMESQGYLFNEDGEGYSDFLKDKAPNGDAIALSTGHYYIGSDGYVRFWYYFKDSGDKELDDYPE